MTRTTLRTIADTNAGLPRTLWIEAVMNSDLPLIVNEHWSSDGSLADLGDEVVLRMTWEGGEHTYFRHGETEVHVEVTHGEVYVAVAAKSEPVAREVIARLREALPVTTYEDGECPITFWTYSPQGARSMTRRITTPTWSEIQHNYAAATQDELARLMDKDFRPALGGQLILWQGIPGTGKTFALRGLASEWREWASFHYIVDPERFFGEFAEYMMDVLVFEEGDLVSPVGIYDEKPQSQWKVLILEDTGELLSADAKERSGQALSRLLNVVDGIIGQGLRVLVLVTTNEEIKSLHPAVARPGRCAAQVAFAELSAQEATAWLNQHAMGEHVVAKDTVLADLYARAEGYGVARERHAVGFTAA